MHQNKPGLKWNNYANQNKLQDNRYFIISRTEISDYVRPSYISRLNQSIAVGFLYYINIIFFTFLITFTKHLTLKEIFKDGPRSYFPEYPKI